MKMFNIDAENLHICSTNFNEISKKDVTYDDIKNHEKL